MREQIKALEYHAYFLADFVDISLTVQRNTVDNNAAGSRCQQSCQQLDDGTLTGTGRTDNRQRFTLTYIHIKIIKNHLAAEGHFKLSELNHSFV